jgi:phospholipid/cholesterol/gamma-HCH transport system substrate-binding protein/paraquat-inducible protein B
VTLIGLSGDLYERDKPFSERRQYVVVRMQIFGETVNENLIKDFVKNNLRAQVKSQGITGVNYIEFNFTPNANTYAPLPYEWNPEYPIIPSLPNQADQIIGGIQKLIDGMNELNINDTQKKFDALLNNLNLLMAGNGKDNEGIIQSVKDLNVLLARISKVTDKDELNILMRELIGTVVSLRQTIASIQGDSAVTIENLKQTSEQLNELTRIASQSPASLIWSDPPPRITLPMNGVQK